MFTKPNRLLAFVICLGLAGSPLSAFSQQDHSGHGGNDQAAHDHSGQGGDMMQHDGDGQGGGMMQRGGDGQAGGMMRRMRGMGGNQQQAVATSGQSAMDVISEVIQTLQANPDTDWSRINIDALRQHLVDMDRVAMYAEAEASDIEGGSLFRVSGPDDRTIAAIQRMVPDHALQIERELGWEISTETTGDGIELRVTAQEAEVDMIRAIGFVGFMVLGQHHADHHLMMAGGQPASASGGNGQGGGMMQRGGSGGGQDGGNHQSHGGH